MPEESALRVALFAKQFLEPTHHAIAAVLISLGHCLFSVYAKRLTLDCEPPGNVVEYAICSPGSMPVLARGGYDLVHAIFDGDLAIVAATAARRAGLPFVLSFHGGFDTQAKIFQAAYAHDVREIASAATAVTVVCRADEARLHALGVQRRIDVVPVPIDPALVPLRRHVEPGCLIVIARLIEKKGVDTAIETLRQLPEEFRLTIVGDGPLGGGLKAQAQDSKLGDRVEFAGRLSLAETLRLAAGSEALLHLARVARDGNAEGTPQTILWAQAMGLPVVACATGSLGEIVAHRRTGMLVPPDEPTGIARAILELRSNSNLRRHIVAAARRQVRRRHLLSDVSARMLGIYRRLAAPPFRPAASTEDS